MESNIIDWPVHRLSGEDMYTLFLQMNSEHVETFTDKRNFILYLNTILSESSFQNTIIIKEEFHPKHQFYYEIIHPDLNFDTDVTMADIDEMIANENKSK